MKKKIRLARKVAVKSVRAVLYPGKATEELKTLIKRRNIDKERNQSYRTWFEANKTTTESLRNQRIDSKKFKQKPLISVLVPIYNTPEIYLRACIDSVINQSYENWELCIADDASPEPIIEVVKEYSAKYPNIKWIRLKENRHIAGSSNEALKLAKGEFVALLDHDDVLEPNALFEMVAAYNENTKADFIYSDEDKIEDGVGRLEPFFKPDWSPEFLRSCNYITHFSMLRRSIMNDIGGFRMGTEGAQDWDLFLRFTEVTKNIVHIPKILYGWRKISTSTAMSPDSKPYAYINQRCVLRESVKKSGRAGSVFDQVSRGFWRVRYQINNNPKVSIIIPTKNNFNVLETCLYSIIDKTSYANFEIVIVDTGSTDQNVLDLYKSNIVTTNEVTVTKWKGEKFNFSSACNYGVKKSTGEYIVFLNDDTEVLSSDWLESLLEHAQGPGVGMVGAKLLFPDDTIQHAGVVLSERDIAFHPFYGSSPKHDIFTNIYIENTRNCSAVTAACSMINRKAFDKVGGFDEELRVTYNDVDLCLRLLDSGLRNIYTPNATLYHHESVSVGKINTKERDDRELAEASKLMRQRWSKYLKRDPFYNENFEQFGPGYRL